MNKHMRKSGITAHKFMIEIHMTKVELKLAHQCRISVIFKRGEHKKETVNAPVLDKGVAYFDEKLAVPSIFYFDEAKNAFVSKEATLALNMISSKAQRLMGVTKFDLSVYLNNNMKDTNVDLKMEKCFDKAAKFHFRLKMTQLSELDPCMSFKEDEVSTSQILNENNKSPSRIHFAEQHPDLSHTLLADNSDFGEGRSLSPRPESMNSVDEKSDPSTSHRKSPKVELNRSTEEKVSTKQGTKTAPHSYREKVSPRQVKEDNLQKSKTMQQKGKQTQNQKREQIVDDTPRFPNQRRPTSPFDQSKDSINAHSTYSPLSEEPDRVRRTPTPTDLGEVRPFKEAISMKESKSTGSLRTVNTMGSNKKFTDSPSQPASNKKKKVEEESRDLDSDSTEQYKAYERAVKEEKMQEEDMEVDVKPNKKSKWHEKAEKEQKKWEENERFGNEPYEKDESPSNKPTRDYKIKEEDRDLYSEPSDQYRGPQEETREVVIELNDKTRPYEKPVKAYNVREEERRLDEKINENGKSKEGLVDVQKIKEANRRENSESDEKAKSYEKLAKELKEQLDQSHEEYLELSKKYEELKQTHNMLQIDYQTLQKGTANDRKSEKRTDFELTIYKEKVLTLQRELLEQKVQNENLMKSLKVQGQQQAPESKESLDSEESDLRQPSHSTQNPESSQIKQYEQIINDLRNELKDLKNKYDEKQLQINNVNDRQNLVQNPNYSQLSQQHQHQNQSALNRELERSQITISELTNGITKLRKENGQKDTKIESLEGHIKELEDEIQFLKLQEERSKIQSLDLSDHSLEKINFDAKGSNETPENLQKTIQELMVQNLGLKKELEQLKRILSLNQLDNDKKKEELAVLSRKHEGEDLDKKIAELGTENARLTSELKKAKMGWAAADIEKYNSVTAAKESLEKVKKSEERVDLLEIEIFRLKSRLAELVNSIMEFGGVELLDKVEEIVALDKSSKLSVKEDLKKTVLS